MKRVAQHLAPGAPAPRRDSWRIIGPGGGGAQYHPTVSPHDPLTVLIASDMTGAYITHDGGASWRMFNLRKTIRLFVFDPRDPQVIYAAAGSLFRSTDNGASWQRVFPLPQAIRAINRGNDHASENLCVADGAAGSVTAFAVDPADSRSLYAAVRNQHGTALWMSCDRALTWCKVADLGAEARAIWIDPRSPPGDRTLYVAGATAIVRREHGCWHGGESPGVFSDLSAGFPAEGPPVIYATGNGHIFVSLDGGVRWWRSSALAGFEGAAQAIATSLDHPDVAYVSYSGRRFPLGGSIAVAKTIDGGLHWELVRGESSGNVNDAWISERFGPRWGGAPLAIAVAPHDPDTCYTTDNGRTLRTIDGGKSWSALYSTRMLDGGWTTTGLDVTTCYGVHFDPFDPQRLFISYTDIGLFVSNNAGASWHSATHTGVPRSWRNTTYWLVLDPNVRGRMWAAMSGIHDLPRAKMWHSLSPSMFTGGVVRSDDGGHTWRVSGVGMPETAATHILLDPSGALYVAGFGRGVFKSLDGGLHWLAKNSGIEGEQPFAWRLARDGQGTLYLVVVRRSDDGSFANPEDGALYRSTDSAEHWTRIVLPKGVNGPNGIAIDPGDPQRLYLAAWGRSTAEGAVDGGIFLSTDAGATWRSVLSQDQHIYDVTIDQRDPRVLYATGFESSAWRSADRGLTWRRLGGFNFKWGHRVIPDPADASKVYITTFGGSVWHGPAAGEPDAREDIVL